MATKPTETTCESDFDLTQYRKQSTFEIYLHSVYDLQHTHSFHATQPKLLQDDEGRNDHLPPFGALFRDVCPRRCTAFACLVSKGAKPRSHAYILADSRSGREHTFRVGHARLLAVPRVDLELTFLFPQSSSESERQPWCVLFAAFPSPDCHHALVRNHRS